MKTQRILVIFSLLAATGVGRAQTLSGPTDLDHFTCYIPFQQPPQPDQPVSVFLQDEFDQAAPAATFVPGSFEKIMDLTAWRLCTPVTKVHTGVTTGELHPDAHLLMYWLNDQPSAPRSVTVLNQFGTSTLTTGAAVVLAVPTGKTPITPAAGGNGFFAIPPIPSGAELDHFKCYMADGPPVVIPGTIFGVDVTLTDQFTKTQKFQIGVPWLFCNPVEKVVVTVTTGGNANGDQNGNGPAASTVTTGISHPQSHLTCYILSVDTPITGVPQSPFSVIYNNQFVTPDLIPILSLLPGGPEMLCAPSFKLRFGIVPTPISGPPLLLPPG